MKRKFYIIGHNPDTVYNAVNALNAKANALEPDLTYDPTTGKYFVYDPSDSNSGPELKDYLDGLAYELVNNPNLNLALIAWDMKSSYDPGFNFQTILSIIYEYFTATLLANEYGEIPMLFTTPHNYGYLEAAAPYLTNYQAIGSDEHSDAGAADSQLRGTGVPYTFGYGESVSGGMELIVYAMASITAAISIRNTGNSFSLVYAWTANENNSMEFFLNLGVDGMITDNPSMLYNQIIDNYSNTFEIATRKYNPFARKVQPLLNFMLKTYTLASGEMFIVVNGNNPQDGSTLLKVNPSACQMGHNMFNIIPDGNGDYSPVPATGALLGTQTFLSYIVDLFIASDSTTNIAFVDGRVLKVQGTGGTGHNMFNIFETFDYFNASLTGKSYYIGHQKFNHQISLFKYITGNTFIGLIDGKLLLANNSGGTGQNMYQVTENYSDYQSIGSSWIGDSKFIEPVMGIEVVNGFTFIWFYSGKLLKLTGSTGTWMGHNMFGITENIWGFFPYGSNSSYYGDALFSGAVTTLIFVNPYLLIGFNNGKILKVSQTGGFGHNFCNVIEYPDHFDAEPSTIKYYVGDTYFANCIIRDLKFYNGNLMVVFSFLGPAGGFILKISGTGGSGQNMFAVMAKPPLGFVNCPGYSYLLGDSNTAHLVSGLNMVNKDLIVECFGRLLLIIQGTGSSTPTSVTNMFDLIELPDGFMNYYPYTQYYIGDQFFN